MFEDEPRAALAQYATLLETAARRAAEQAGLDEDVRLGDRNEVLAGLRKARVVPGDVAEAAGELFDQADAARAGAPVEAGVVDVLTTGGRGLLQAITS